MERDVWDILKAVDAGRINVIDAHKKICSIQDSFSHSILNQCMNEQEEVVSSPIRFNGISVEKLQKVFAKNGIQNQLEF